jgi:acetylornithine/succinyldiaminopimelate/putrescine aminotransferase
VAPIGATLGTDRNFSKVYSSKTRVQVHDTTYSHNNTAAAAGLAALSVIDDEGLVANAAERGAELADQLRQAATRYEFITDVRGEGLMVGVEFGRPSSLRLRARYSPLSLARKGLFTQMVVCDLFERHHILTQTAADHMDVLKLLPPLTCSREDVAWFMSAFTGVMDTISNSSRPIWHFAKALTTRTVAGKP